LEPPEKYQKVLKKNLEAIPGKHSMDSPQRTAILVTSHITRKVLQSETGSLSVGDHLWFKRRSIGKKRPVTTDNNSDYDDDDDDDNNNNNNPLGILNYFV
jgi:hypothetical protein